MHINEDDHEFYQILEWYWSMPIKESQILIGPLFNEPMKVGAVAVMQIVMTPIIAPIVTAVKAAAAQTIVQDFIIIITEPAMGMDFA